MLYRIVYTNRKTVAVSIDKTGTLVVRAPLKMSEREIEKILERHKAQVERIKNKADSILAEKSAFRISYGMTLNYLGGEYKLKAWNSDRCSFDGECFLVPDGLDEQQLAQAISVLYKKLGVTHIKSRVEYFAPIVGVQPENVNVNSAKTHWGSCNTKKNLNFSWRLFMADIETVDYVVIHELAHIRQMNHSAEFWEIVGSVMPNYAVCKKKLRELQNRIEKQNWYD